MCGIAGAVGPDVDEALLVRLRDALRHRGPDGEGIWLDARRAVGLAHTRLAILDVSDAGLQPMHAADGHGVLVYNGECYNFRDLAERLEEDNVHLRSHSDSEVVLEWLCRRGEAGLSDFRGMYALAFADLANERLLLARDPHGIKPLYVARVRGSVIFASEVRALLATGLMAKRINPKGLWDYLSYGYVLEPETIVDGVSALGPGSWLSIPFDGGEPSSGRIEWRRPPRSIGPDDVRAAFVDAVESHLVSDVPIGAFLSGGVDSSAIVAAMKSAGQEVAALTVSFPDQPAWDETPLARDWTQTVGVELREVPLRADEIREALPDAIAAQDQPTVDAVNTFVVSRAAREGGLTVALSGLGGDELFGGYPTTNDVPKALRIRRSLGPFASAAAATVRACAPRWGRRGNKIADLLSSAPEVDDVYLARRRLLTHAQVRALCPDLADASAAPFATSECADADDRDRVGCLDEVIYMRNSLLRDSDAMGMACGLEIRVPFLDLEFAAVARAAGPEWHDGKRKFVAAIGELAPPGVCDRPKRGFTLPFERWMQGELGAPVSEALGALTAPFDRAAVDDLWHAFVRDPRRVGWTRPWALFSLATFLDRHGLTG